MRIIKSFKDFIKEGIVKTITPDMERAKDLLQESTRKNILLQKMIASMGIDDNNANDYIEYCYNIIMFLIRAKMLEYGYTSSGKGAHEAEMAFGGTIGLRESEIRLLDQLRYFRKGILYYGKRFDKDYAKIVISFTKDICVRLA